MSDLTLKLPRAHITLLAELATWAQTELRGTGFAYPLAADHIHAVAESITDQDGEEFTMHLEMFSYRAITYWRDVYKNRTDDTRFDALGELMHYRLRS